MSIKERSTFKKQEFEYNSPDGDQWIIVYVETENRKYIQLSKAQDAGSTEGSEIAPPFSCDLQMLIDIADEFRDHAVSVRPRKGTGELDRPMITDLRSSAEQIQLAVDETMSNFKDGTPMESLGIQNVAMRPVEDTPKPWSLDNIDEISPAWKKEAKERANLPRPNYQKKGPKGQGFKRQVGAGDLI